MAILKAIYAFFIDSVQSVLLAAAVFLVVYVFLFRPFQVNGQSMFPTFHDHEQVITNLVGLRFHDLKRGDVIVFKAPPDPEKDYIKRVIGVGGETVGLKNGDVYINNIKLDESAYLSSDVKTYSGAFLHDGADVTVPEGDYLVLGDNRPFSSDSREWGFVKKSDLIGESLFVYWPINRMRVVNNPYKN